MKQFFKSIFSLLLAFTVSAVPALAAEGELDPATQLQFEVRNPEAVMPGELAFINLILVNPNVEYAAIESLFEYPAGWTAEKFSQKDAGIGDKNRKAFAQIIPEGRLDETEQYDAFSILGNNPTENTFRLAIYDSGAEGKTIVVGNDAIAVFAIRVPADATPGNYSVSVRDIWLSTGDPDNAGDGGIDPFTFTVTVKQGFLVGDVNNDGDVNVIDITALIDEIMNDGTNERADVNQDGEINVIDITALIDIIMNS